MEGDQTPQSTADRLKELGNDMFKNNNFKVAYEYYTKAIEICPSSVLYCNRSICNLKLEFYGESLSDAEMAIKLDPGSVKGYYRRASAHYYIGNLKKACQDYEKCLVFKPKSQEIKKKLNECKKEYKRRQFLEAIRMEDPPSIIDTLRLDDIIVEKSYQGPRLEDQGEGVVTQEFIDALIPFYKEKVGTLHRRYICSILLQVQRMFKALPNVLPLSIPAQAKEINLCGDIHGQFYDLLNIFEKYGYPSASNPYLFNGDFTDRGSFSVEVAVLLFSYKLLCPESMYLIRGNHETDINKMFGFEAEVLHKYNAEVMKLFREVFNTLPLAAVIEQKVIVLHGGLFEEPNVSIRDINKLDRFNNGSSHLMEEILWSDPADIRGTQPSRRGAGVQFGSDVTKAFLDYNNLSLLVRSHEMKDNGYEITHDNRCVTLFSAANYCDQCGNKGAIMKLGRDLIPRYDTFDGVPHPPPGPMAYVNCQY